MIFYGSRLCAFDLNRHYPTTAGRLLTLSYSPSSGVCFCKSFISNGGTLSTSAGLFLSSSLVLWSTSTALRRLNGAERGECCFAVVFLVPKFSKNNGSSLEPRETSTSYFKKIILPSGMPNALVQSAFSAVPEAQMAWNDESSSSSSIPFFHHRA